MKFLKKTLKRHGHAKKTVTDRLRAYGAAFRERGINDQQETGGWAKTRAEKRSTTLSKTNAWRCCASGRMRTLQKFASVQASVFNHFNKERSLSSRQNVKVNRHTARTGVASTRRGLTRGAGQGKPRRVRIRLTAPGRLLATGTN